MAALGEEFLLESIDRGPGEYLQPFHYWGGGVQVVLYFNEKNSAGFAVAVAVCKRERDFYSEAKYVALDERGGWREFNEAQKCLPPVPQCLVKDVSHHQATRAQCFDHQKQVPPGGSLRVGAWLPSS